MSTKSDQIAWRRSKVVEFRAKGMTHDEIAHELQVSRQSITSDIGYLREQAKQTIKEYATDHLPAQYQVCLSALDTILKHAYEILQDSEDNREKIQAMELFKDTHVTKLELSGNATTIDSALEFIRSKQQSQQKKANEDTSDNPSISTATTTTAGKQSVF